MASRLGDVSKNLSSAFGSSPERLIADVAGRTENLYRDGKERLLEHYGVAAAVAATAVGSCLVGFAAGRRRSRRVADERRPPSSLAQQAASVVPGSLSEMDIGPVFRFLKLWMLYRVATKD